MLASRFVVIPPDTTKARPPWETEPVAGSVSGDTFNPLVERYPTLRAAGKATRAATCMGTSRRRLHRVQVPLGRVLAASERQAHRLRHGVEPVGVRSDTRHLWSVLRAG